MSILFDKMTRHYRALRSVAMVSIGALALSSVISGVPAAAATGNSEEFTNWAAASNGASAEASGQEVPDNWGPAKLIDGQINPDAEKPAQSRWSSDKSDDAWATVTFAAPKTLDHIDLWMHKSCPKKWDLYVSEDGNNYFKIKSEENQNCPQTGTEKVTADLGIYKHALISQVKLQVRERTPIGGVKYGASLWEIQAFGPSNQAPAPAPEQNYTPASSLVPKPVHLTAPEGQPGFTLTPDLKIVAGADLAKEAEVLASALRASTGFDVPVVAQAAPSVHAIRLAKGNVEGAPATHHEEAYSLVSNQSGVTITGVGAHGVFNGSMTLLQLLPGFIHMKTPVLKDWVVPAVQIKDWPRYAYRGMMLDIARSFVPKDDIKKLIDTLSQYKVSALHLHLSDDQGWRIEITNEGRAEGDTIDYTRLTKISGKTAMLPHDKQASHEIGRTGFLTQKDYKEIQAYAAARHVMIVPEIDVPGHINGALHAIPELNTAGSSHLGTEAEPTAPANGTGDVGYSYLDPNAEVSKTFIKHVFKQIADMTTGPYMHIGGDEPHKMTDRYGSVVYNRFLGDVLTIVRGLHKTPFGWNEISQANGITDGDTMHFWIGDANITRAAVTDHHAKVLLSKGGNSYLSQKYNSKTPMAASWACRDDCDFKHYYDWDPRVFIGLDNDDSIRGTETALWAETVRGLDQVEFLTFNRTLSHAEIGWTPQAQRNKNDFASRVSQVGVDLNATGSNFYDGTDGTWGYDVAGVKSVATATNGKFQLGYLSAPGTKVSEDGLRVKADTVNDADGVSRSLAPANGLQVMVDWGDGSAAEPATITSTLPRSRYNASGMYVLTASHQFTTAGQHEVTLTAGNRTAKAIINVDAAGTASKPLFTPWTATADATLKLGQRKAKVLDRVEFDVSGFEPNTLVEVFLGKTKLGEVRPDADGTRHMYILIPGNVTPGVYEMRAVHGDRSAKTSIAIWGAPAATPLKSEVSGLTVQQVSSQESVGEHNEGDKAIDGKLNTMWHTAWNGNNPFPHYIALNLNKSCMVSGLEYTARQSEDNGKIKNYKIYTSVDGTNWGEPVKTGQFTTSTAAQYVGFTPVKANFVKLESLSSHNGRAFTSAAEIRIDGVCGTPFAAHIGEGEAAVELSGDSENPAAVKAAAQSEVTVSLSGLHFAGQATLWAGDDHELVANTEVTAGQDASLSFTVKPEWDGKRVELITPKNRRYFVLHVKNQVAPVQPSVEGPVEPSVETPAGAVLHMAEAPALHSAAASDVPAESMFAGEIHWMMKNQYSTGYSDGTYRPLGSVNRDAMAAFLYRLAGSPAVNPNSDSFKDVPKHSMFSKEITWMKQSGISNGWDDGTYRPLEPVSREAMAAFLYRFCDQMPDKCASAINPDNFKVSEDAGFKDVPVTHQFAKPIAWLAAAKVSTGWTDGTFRPNEPIHRDAMAAFLYRLKNNHVEEVK